MAGNAILTLIINGTTAGQLIKMLGLTNVSCVKERSFVNLMINLKSDIIERIKDLQKNY
jgi:hypothetical protein